MRMNTDDSAKQAGRQSVNQWPFCCLSVEGIHYLILIINSLICKVSMLDGRSSFFNCLTFSVSRVASCQSHTELIVV